MTGNGNEFLELYAAGRWSAVLEVCRQYEPLVAFADGALFRFIARHCEIELGLPVTPAPQGETSWATVLDNPFFFRARQRLLQCCDARDLPRVAALLDLLQTAFPQVAAVRQGLWRDSDPISDIGHVSHDLPIDDDLVADMRAIAANLTIVIVMMGAHTGTRDDWFDVAANFARSARRFGFTVHTLEPHWIVKSPDYVAAVAEFFDQVSPDIIFYDNFFEIGVLAAKRSTPELQVAMANLLAERRQTHGTLVTNFLSDAWFGTEAEVTAGLGSVTDLVIDCVPERRFPGFLPTDRQRLCYMPAYLASVPSVPLRQIPRAAFVGSASWFNFPRAVWRAELLRNDLPVDFFETRHEGHTELRSFQAYFDILAGHRLSLNLTRRHDGTRIVTGRSIEVPLVGGCLVEEDNASTRYFLNPGEHYLPFRTLPQLAEICAAYLPDDSAGAEIARAGQDYVQHRYTGDYFWTGVLLKLL